MAPENEDNNNKVSTPQDAAGVNADTSQDSAPPQADAAVAQEEPTNGTLNQADIDTLTNSTGEQEQERKQDSPAPAEQADGEMPPLPDFSGMLADAASSSIELLNDVELDVKIELGRAIMEVEQILHLSNGSVVELDKLAGDPVDVLVNGQLIARGEVLVINDNFCVRINEIIPGRTENLRNDDAIAGV